MMTLTFLGVGSAFAKRNYQSNALIEVWNRGPDEQPVPDDTLMIDFGGTGPAALYELMRKPGFEYLEASGQINYPAIKRLFVSHQHADHIGGLEEMAFINTYGFRKLGLSRPFKPQLISAASILANLWDTSLKGGLGAMGGRYALLQDYFFILSLQPGEGKKGTFTLGKRYEFKPFQTDHIQVERKYDWPSFGLEIMDTRTGESVFYSGDSRFNYPAYAHMLERAKICFHEAQLIDQDEPVHALISELRSLPEAIRKKTVIYHYGDEFDAGPYDDVGEVFAGFAEAQRRYVLFS